MDHLLLSSGLFRHVRNVQIDHSYNASDIAGHWPLIVELSRDRDRLPNRFENEPADGSRVFLSNLNVFLLIGVAAVCVLFGLCKKVSSRKEKSKKFWFGLDRGEFGGVVIPVGNASENPLSQVGVPGSIQ